MTAQQSENLAEEEIGEDDAFALAEDTDLNEEELDLNVSRKMSIRALNVVTMHRFSPGSITNGNQRLSNVGMSSYRSDSALKVGSKQSMNRPSMLLRASSLLQANARKSSINHRQTLSRISQLKG